MKRTKTLLAALVCTLTAALAGCGEQKAGNSGSSERPAVSASSTTSAPGDSSDGITGSTNDPASSTGDVTSEVTSDTGDPLSTLWNGALYTEDCEIGSGAHNALITVKIGSRDVTITVKSDKSNLAEMLTESGLVEGEESSYGLYIKKVNGVLADYDTDKAFWSLLQNGTPTAVGASSITVSDGDAYELVYTAADDMNAAA